MGIYPNTTESKFTVGDDDYLLHMTSEPGVVHNRLYRLVAEFDDRTDCYCCSCGEHEGSDPSCRNHGFSGERPCDVHNMPGTPDEDGRMPVSVQEARRLRKQRETLLEAIELEG